MSENISKTSEKTDEKKTFSGYALRRMVGGDLLSVYQIEEKVAIKGWSYNLFVSSLCAGDECWVLSYGREISGFIIYRSVLDEAEILNIAIKPTYQRQGLGEYLLLFLINTLTEKKIINCFLEVRESNAAAIALYEKCGFVMAGVRQNYYPLCDKSSNKKQEWEHAKIMRWRADND